MNVAVVGASDKPEKYSYKAVMLLKENDHLVFPVHPTLSSIEGIRVYSSLRQITEPVDTISVYVSSEVSTRLMEEILGKSPRRIILNPGAENPELEESARARGIQVLNACTLVMLKTHQF